jgi:hypothetical protein
MEDHSPGDILHVESEIVEITPSRSKPHQGIITVRGTMFNRNREAVYLLMAKLLVLRRPQLIEGSPLIQSLRAAQAHLGYDWPRRRESRGGISEPVMSNSDAKSES